MVLNPHKEFCRVIEKLEEDFLNNFFDNVRKVILTMLTYSVQEPNASVEYFIKRWSHLASRSKGNLKAASIAEMCMKNLHAMIRAKFVKTYPQSFNQLMKMIGEVELAAKQKGKKKLRLGTLKAIMTPKFQPIKKRIK